jgi:hypothetical protein
MNAPFNRRQLIRAMTGVAAAALISPALMAQTTKPRPQVEVWKDPNCGCCGDWVEHMKANGFDVRVNDVGNAATRARLGVPTKLGSCHTAVVGGYAIEGHVPAADIHRLLKERPNALGLTVPGMPVGSPGMDGEVYGARRDPYDVLLIAKGGQSTRVFKSYNRPAALT